jgi:hypothetical protein
MLIPCHPSFSLKFLPMLGLWTSASEPSLYLPLMMVQTATLATQGCTRRLTADCHSSHPICATPMISLTLSVLIQSVSSPPSNPYVPHWRC